MDLGTDIKLAQNGTLAHKLDGIGWALFLIMIGCLALLPSGLVPKGTWLAGTGLIMIGINVVRHVKGVRVGGFSAVLGMIALALGMSAVAGVDLPVLPLLIAAIGLQMIYNVLASKRGTR